MLYCGPRRPRAIWPCLTKPYRLTKLASPRACGRNSTEAVGIIRTVSELVSAENTSWY